MHRTPPEGTKMPPPLRVLPALLLLLFVTAPLLHCSATVGNSSSSVATRTGTVPAASNRALPTILQCYPGIVLYGSNRNYRCRTDDPSPLVGLALCTLHTNDGSIHKCVWYARVHDDFFQFDAGNGWSISGGIPLAFGRWNTTAAAETNRFITPFMRPDETTASFTVPNPYYGMSMSVEANLPVGQSVARYALLFSRGDCPRFLSECHSKNRCYDLTDMRLPPPGSYKLCVTGVGWEEDFLPWGASTVETSALVATPLTFANGVVPSIKLHNGDTSAVVTPENIKIYLVRCATGTCPSVRPLRGDPMVAVAACDEVITANRVELSSAALNVPAGTYALCVVDGNDKFSPAAFPVTVLQEPFTMEVDSTSSTSSTSSSSVTLQVGGGDLASRTEPYEVCIVENGASCDNVTSESKCTKSAEPNAQTVDVDLSNFASGRISFCLVAKRATYNDRTYLDVQVQIYHVLENGIQQSSSNDGKDGNQQSSSNDGKNGNQQAGGGEMMLIWLPILIVLLFALAVCGAIFAVRHWRRRKARTEEERAVNGLTSSVNPLAPLPETRSLSVRSADGEQLSSGCVPSAHSSSHSLRADPQEGMERASSVEQ